MPAVASNHFDQWLFGRREDPVLNAIAEAIRESGFKCVVTNNGLACFVCRGHIKLSMVLDGDSIICGYLNRGRPFLLSDPGSLEAIVSAIKQADTSPETR